MWFRSDGQHYQQRIFDLLLNMIVFCCKLYSERNTFASIKFGKCKPCLRPCSASMILSFLLTLLPLNWLWLPFHPYVWSRETNIEAWKRTLRNEHWGLETNIEAWKIYSPSSSYTHSPCFTKKDLYSFVLLVLFLPDLWFFSQCKAQNFDSIEKLPCIRTMHQKKEKKREKIENCQLWSVPCTCQSWPCITVWCTHTNTNELNL